MRIHTAGRKWIVETKDGTFACVSANNPKEAKERALSSILDELGIRGVNNVEVEGLEVRELLIDHKVRGSWSGQFVCGFFPTNVGVTVMMEGFEDGEYEGRSYLNVPWNRVDDLCRMLTEAKKESER